jgi:hypothetical protein
MCRSFSEKLKIELPYDAGVYSECLSKGIELRILKQYLNTMFIAALFTIAKGKT